jgi:hypothetical protein
VRIGDSACPELPQLPLSYPLVRQGIAFGVPLGCGKPFSIAILGTAVIHFAISGYALAPSDVQHRSRAPYHPAARSLDDRVRLP